MRSIICHFLANSDQFWPFLINSTYNYSHLISDGRNARAKSVFCPVLGDKLDPDKEERQDNYFLANVEIHRKDVNANTKNRQVLNWSIKCEFIRVQTDFFICSGFREFVDETLLKMNF